MNLPLPLSVFALLSFTLCAAQPTAAQATKASRPNILFVLLDDLGGTDLGCYGSRAVSTPCLDRFSQEGMRFTDAYAAMPTCTPSRACILSGQCSPRHGIYAVSPSEDKVEEARKYEAQQANQALTSVSNRHALPRSTITLGAALRDAGYSVGFAGKWHHDPSPEECGFAISRITRGSDDPKQMFALTAAAIDFIREQQRGKPWFFYLSHHAPHVRNESRRETLAKYQAREQQIVPVRPDYAAMVEDVDTACGKLLAELDRLGLRENTMVVVSSDNGGYLKNTTNAPFRGGKGQFYEGGLRAPLLVRWPAQIRPGLVCPTPVQATDLFPTFAEVAGVSLPREVRLDGTSLTPLWRGKDLPARDLFWHFPHYNLAYGQGPCSVIRSGRHKLIYFYEGERAELYDLKDDPSESRNLVQSQPELAATIRTKLDAWLHSVQAPLPAPKVRKAVSSVFGSTADFLAQVATSTPAPAPKPTPPNIILILADDFGYECVTANGGRSYSTPNLDRLASRGVRFTHCYSQPLCTPTRVQLMTGLYNFRNYTRFAELAADQRTFGHFLQSAGYATCLAHKWQLGPKEPDHFGFDEYAIHRPSRSHWGMQVVRNGKEIQLPDSVYGPDYFADFALDFITRHKERPFFVYFPIWLTHEPFDATPDSVDRTGRQDRKHFGDMVAYLDKIVGRITAKLDELGLRENTLLIFTADNGVVQGIETKTESGTVVGGKSRLTDAGTHVPLIVDWPGKVQPGKVCSDLVDTTDFVPTLAEAAGVKLPQGIPFDGRSFLPAALGKASAAREWVLLSSDPRKPDRDAPPGKRRAADDAGGNAKWCVRNQRWKLYYDGRFFDLVADSPESKPLPAALSGEGAAAKKALARALAGLPRLDRLEETPRQAK